MLPAVDRSGCKTDDLGVSPHGLTECDRPTGDLVSSWDGVFAAQHRAIAGCADEFHLCRQFPAGDDNIIDRVETQEGRSKRLR